MTEFLNFDKINNNEIINRTNNIVESFHHRLNSTVEIPHPRISILIEKFKFISIDFYKNYVSKLFQGKKNRDFKQNVYRDIYNFLEKFLIKYDKNINIKLLTQDEGETKNLFETITNNILSELYNIKFSEYENEQKDVEEGEEENDKNEYKNEQILNDLEEN